MTLEELKRLWAKLGEIPINEDEEIEKDFLHFEKGTHRMEVWGWFDEELPNGLGEDILNSET